MADTPNVGDKHEVTHPAGIGVGFGAVPAGTVVTVHSVLDPATPGIGHSTEQTVRVEFEEPGLVLDEETGHPKQGKILRALAIPVSDFDKYFGAVSN
jgi:hypothetical protein